MTGISPAIGYAGTQVTISGSGFGTSQNSGSVLLGSTLGLIVSWSNTQIVAIVSAGSTSGVAQIQQNGLSSNTLQFTVNPATTITNVFPTNGLPGTQVTISGSGFGATQGSGNVWLGTTPAIVNNWSDGQIIATVGAGAATGNALVLQNGTLSNAVPFTINLPQITGITPNTGSEGTVVTITGVSFGTTQGSGTVLIGSTNGSVIGWSNTQVTASVAANAVSGIVQIQQNGAWSNGITFTVPPTLGSGMSAVTLVPNQINMVVGGTQAIEAVSSTGQSVTGLTWTSSDTAVATLSTDDPPIITAVGVGTSFITAGGAAAAKLTVLAGTTLPTGTVIWSNPGDGTGVSYIVPAVPSSTGVADVFALNADGNVQAITSVGMTAWTANVGTSVGPSNLIPDFQGGLVVASGQSIYRLDGMTGTPSTWTYNSVSGSYLPTPVVHTDGTIFTVDGNAVVGINPKTGSNFSVAMEATTNNGAPVSSPPGPSSIGNLIIAGDGYAYVPYQYSQGSSAETQTVSTGSSTSYLNVLRVGSGGDSSEISVKQWSQSSSSVSAAGGYIPFLTPYSEIIFGAVLNTYCGSLGGCPTEVTETFFSSSSGASGLPSLITNADQGVLLSFQALEGSQSQTTDVYCEAPGCPNEIPSELTSSTSSYNNGVTNNYLATIASGGGVSLAMLNLPGPAGPIQPVLQRADGSYVGTANTSAGSLMMAFTASGQQLWSQPNDTPQIATAGGGVIGTSGTTYDQNGNTTGQLASLPTTTYSWKGAYQLGS
ncbi:MAG: IPT/TIG domain-containing protein, partial [Candidatus Sulfotelmatobacter sp.]